MREISQVTKDLSVYRLQRAEEDLRSDISDMIGKAFKIRNKSDYDDMYIVSRDDTKEQIENAKQVIGRVQEYMKSEDIL